MCPDLLIGFSFIIIIYDHLYPSNVVQFSVVNGLMVSWPYSGKGDFRVWTPPSQNTFILFILFIYIYLFIVFVYFTYVFPYNTILGDRNFKKSL